MWEYLAFRQNKAGADNLGLFWADDVYNYK